MGIIFLMIGLILIIFPYLEKIFNNLLKYKENKKIKGILIAEEEEAKQKREKWKNIIFILILSGLAGFILNSILPLLVTILLTPLFLKFIYKLKEDSMRKKFSSQILDMVMLLSSCLKSGLSLMQGLEVISEEMSPPISQEIGILAKEVRMGVPLEEALKKLEKRINIEEFTLLVNSILVARQTGGDLTKVFSRLITTIRDNQKLKENIQTLTLQGRLQGRIMSVLPFLFLFWVMGVNKHHFDIMVNSDLGRLLLIVAFFLQVIGMFLIEKFSTIKI